MPLPRRAVSWSRAVLITRSNQLLVGFKQEASLLNVALLCCLDHLFMSVSHQSIAFDLHKWVYLPSRSLRFLSQPKTGVGGVRRIGSQRPQHVNASPGRAMHQTKVIELAVRHFFGERVGIPTPIRQLGFHNARQDQNKVVIVALS